MIKKHSRSLLDRFAADPIKINDTEYKAYAALYWDIRWIANTSVRASGIDQANFLRTLAVRVVLVVATVASKSAMQPSDSEP